MIDNQHKKIIGYRDLSQEEIDAINACKKMAAEVGELCENMLLATDIDMRWFSIARTQLQQGFMALIRSIAKPETF